MAEEIYIYAGFQYQVVHNGGMISMRPLDGQHPNAAKDKHRRAAATMYRDERCVRARKPHGVHHV
jgi:hypothetical protein